MSAAERGSFADRSRPGRMLLAGLGGLWAALTLPLTATAWGATQWVWVFRAPGTRNRAERDRRRIG